MRLLQHAQLAVRDVPIQVNQMMVDLERGNITLRTLDPEGSQLREEIRHAGIRVALALCCSALAVSGAMLLAPLGLLPWGNVGLGLLGAGVVTLSFGLFIMLAAHSLFAAQLHPSEWKRRAAAVLRFFVGERVG
jgi:hypothetical protein